MKLSVCYILKNEGETIYRSLDSVKTFVNEYIIGIDESTTDNTREEVERFFNENQEIKKEIYNYTWGDSFADARNEGMDKATGTHILIMDGHEYIPEKWFNITENKQIPMHVCMPKILEQIEKSECDEGFLHLYQQPFVGEIPNNYFLQPRIYRNGIGKDGKNKMRFGRAAHNVIRNSDPEKALQFPEIIIIHDAPKENRDERAKQRAKMNIEQLEKDLEKKPDDVRALFYLGNTHMEVSEHEKALAAFQRYIDCNGPNTSEKYQVYFHMALENRALKRNAQAMDCLHHAMRIQPMRRDAYIIAGDICTDNDDHERALHYYNTCLIINPELSRMFSNGATSTWMPYQRAAYAYESMGKIEKAVSHLRRAMRFVQTPEWEEKIKTWTGAKKNILVIDAIGSFTKEFIAFLNKKCNVILSKKYDRYLAEWADHIWQEWADGNLAENIMPGKTTVRIHGYEAYTNMNLINQVPWEKYNAIIPVAGHIFDMLPEKAKQKATVIQNGVNLDKFYIKNRKRTPNSIGIAGLLNVKKNPMRLANYIVNNPDKAFNLRVEWQDPFLKSAFEYETKDCKNIIYHGRYDDLNDFWNQVSYVISTSDIESFSFNIAEAMACGCHPLIYPWKGARDIWPADSFIKGNKLRLKPARDMDEERAYIANNYPLDMSLMSMGKILIGEKS